MKKGVSPLISFVLTILLVSAATTIVLTVIKPAFDRMSDSGVVNEATQNLELINSAIKQVASESQGSKRTISLSVMDGEYGVDVTKDFIYYNYTTKTDFSPQGIIGNVRLDKSPVFIEYFNNYVESSNASPPWTIKNGTWQITSGEYSGQNGLAYYNYGTVDSYFALEGRITNKAGTNGEIFALPVPPDDLRLYLTFDENSGNYTYDYSGFNNTGTLYNGSFFGGATICSGGDCPTWTVGKSGYGLQFDGSDDYVYCGGNLLDSSLGNFNDSITIEAWINPNSAGKDNAGRIIDKSAYSLSMQSNNNVRFRVRINGVWYNAISPANSVPFGTWSHVVGVFNGSIMMVYVNGVRFLGGTTLPTFDHSDGYYLFIGAEANEGTSYNFNGTIDEVKIYNRSLSANEVKADYELGIKKLSSTGRTDSISTSANVYLVLANPNGNTNFDEVKIKTNKRNMMLSIPYLNVDLNGTARIPKGNYQLAVENKGFNTTVNKPIIELTIA